MKRIWYFSFILCFLLAGFYFRNNDNRWDIYQKGDIIGIKAGLIEKIMICDERIFESSNLMVNGREIDKKGREEILFTITKASPNCKPEGIRNEEGFGIEQAEAESNQTDALSVIKREGKRLQKVQWVDSIKISRESFGKIFNKHTSQVLRPDKDIRRLTVTFISNKVLKGIYVEVNYEIYSGYSAICKWVKIKNTGSDWIKISGLLLQQFNLMDKFSRVTLLTPSAYGIESSMIAFSDKEASTGIILASEIPSKLRTLSIDGTCGYNQDLFEWVLGPDESFTSEPVIIYAFSGASYPTISSVSTALDRCVEGEFHAFLKQYVLRPVNMEKSIVPVFCTWTNYNAGINDSNMRMAADIASRIGFHCFQIDAGWSDAGPGGGWSVSSTNPDTIKFPEFEKLCNYIQSKNMKTGLWYSVFINEKNAGSSENEPVLYSLPHVRRAGGLGLSLCYGPSREKYISDLVYLHEIYHVEYFKQDLSNICFGDIAWGHESRTLKESYLRGLRGLFEIQDEIHKRVPEIWLQLSHEIYWETPGPPGDLAVLKHADSYHISPNEYWGAGNRSKLVNSSWRYNVDSLRFMLIKGAFRAREFWYSHRGLPLDRIEVFGAVTTNIKGSLTPEIQDRQICSWLMGAPVSFSGDLSSLTEGNIQHYGERFRMLDDLQKMYNIYSYFQFSGVPPPTDTDWHWWGKINSDGYGVVIVMRGSSGDNARNVNIPWVRKHKKYKVKGLFSRKEYGIFNAQQLVKGNLRISLPNYGQEILLLAK